METLTNSSDLEEVDALMRWLDLPFLVDQWTRIYKQAKEKTLRFYLQLLDRNETYKSLDWS